MSAQTIHGFSRADDLQAENPLVTVTVEDDRFQFQRDRIRYDIPVSDLVGAVYSEQGRRILDEQGRSAYDFVADSGAYIEVVVLHPERYMPRRAAWIFKEREQARRFSDQVNELATSRGVRADIVLNSAFGNTIVVGDRVYVSHVKATTNTKLTSTTGYLTGDVAGVTMGRFRPVATSRISVRLNDGSVVRSWFEGHELEKAESFVERLHGKSAVKADAMQDPVSELQKLSELFKEGLLTEAEFTAAKGRILRG